MLIKYSSNEDEKKALQQIINSMICGGALSETVCCDIEEGINFLFFEGMHNWAMNSPMIKGDIREVLQR